MIFDENHLEVRGFRHPQVAFGVAAGMAISLNAFAIICLRYKRMAEVVRR
jgi:hypothetical protein